MSVIERSLYGLETVKLVQTVMFILLTGVYQAGLRCNEHFKKPGKIQKRKGNRNRIRMVFCDTLNDDTRCE